MTTSIFDCAFMGFIIGFASALTIVFLVLLCILCFIRRDFFCCCCHSTATDSDDEDQIVPSTRSYRRRPQQQPATLRRTSRRVNRPQTPFNEQTGGWYHQDEDMTRIARHETQLQPQMIPDPRFTDYAMARIIPQPVVRLINKPAAAQTDEPRHEDDDDLLGAVGGSSRTFVQQGDEVNL
jgi:hypothetical protein